MAYQYPLNGGRINATIGGNTAGAGSLISTGNMTLVGGNNVTLSQNGNAITISGANAPSGSINFSAGTTSGNLASVTFANSNGINFGLNAGTITASHNGLTSQSVQTIGGYATGNTTGQSSQSTIDARSFSISGQGALSVGFSNSMLQMSAPAQSSLSATGIVSISRNGSTISIGAPAFSAGMSTQGNTGGTTGFASNQVQFVGGNNITLSQATGAGGNTISIYGAAMIGGGGVGALSAGTQSVSSGTVNFANSNGITFGMSGSSQITASHNGITSQSVQSQGIQAINLSGNTAGVMASISSGSLSLYGGNNITLSQNANSVTISAGAGGGGGVALAGGGSTVTSGTALLSAAGGALTISGTNQSFNFSVPQTSSLSASGIVSMATNGGTISIGAPAFSVGMSTQGNTSGTTGLATNQFVLAGGNNITLSQATGAGGNTLSIIGGAGGGGGGVALSAGGTVISSGTASFVPAGALTLSGSNQTLSLSVPNTSSIVGVNGVSVITVGNTISISGNGTASTYSPMPTLSRWEYPTQAFTSIPGGHSNNTLSIQHVYVPFNISATAMKIGGSISVATTASATTGTITANLYMGIYTLSGSSLSLATSASANNSFSIASNGSLSLYTGLRQLTVSAPSIVMTPGEYWIAAMLSTTHNYATITMQPMTLYGNGTANVGGAAVLTPVGTATSAGRDVFLLQGIYSSSTTDMPTVIPNSSINNMGASYVQKAGFYHAIYNATY